MQYFRRLSRILHISNKMGRLRKELHSVWMHFTCSIRILTKVLIYFYPLWYEPLQRPRSSYASDNVGRLKLFWRVIPVISCLVLLLAGLGMPARLGFSARDVPSSPPRVGSCTKSSYWLEAKESCESCNIWTWPRKGPVISKSDQVNFCNFQIWSVNINTSLHWCSKSLVRYDSCNL